MSTDPVHGTDVACPNDRLSRAFRGAAWSTPVHGTVFHR